MDGIKAGLPEAMVDRLTLNDNRLRGIISDLRG
jgi:gamma-glutamyl phosphate reductase